MSDREAFLQVYLKEIGVRTPVTLSGQAEPDAETPLMQASAGGRVMHEPVAAPADAGLPGTLDDLAEAAADCRRCRLAEGRNRVVFGTGNPRAELVFIGEAPGRDEDLQGEPFVGRAGKLLDRMIGAIGFERADVYIMNTVKCRPPNNRDPQSDEVLACRHWFDAQLNLLTPKVICLLGRVAAQAVLQSDAPLGALRGRWHEYQGIPVWVTYHPAYLLRSPDQKPRGWSDLQVVRRALQRP